MSLVYKHKEKGSQLYFFFLLKEAFSRERKLKE